MSTEMVLFEARMALEQVRSNEAVNALIFVILVAGIALWLEYIIRRWSWIPRKRHDRIFVERF